MYRGFIFFRWAYLSYHFTKLFKVNMEPCNCALVITGWHVSWIFWMICIAISSASLLGVGRWDGSYPHKYLLQPERLDFCPGIFRSTRLAVLNLGYLLYLDSQSFPLQKSWESVCPLCAWCIDGFTLTVFSIVLEVSLRFSEEIDGALHVTW